MLPFPVSPTSTVRLPLFKISNTLRMVTPELSLCVYVCAYECVCVCASKWGLISIPLTLEELAARTLLFLPTLIPALPSGPVRWTTNRTRYSLLMDRHRAQSLRRGSAGITCLGVYQSNIRISTIPTFSALLRCFNQFLTAIENN